MKFLIKPKTKEKRIKNKNKVNNNIMNGRLFKIKKTTLLRLSFIINMLFFITSTILSLTVFKLPDLWFFSFCLFIGIHLIIKGGLFYLDSACYFGFTLFFCGLFYIQNIILNILYVYPAFVILSFAIASLFTFYLFKESYHFFLALSLLFVSIATLVYIINLISIWIFLAIISVVVLLLIGRYLLIK